ncbi:PREDICTED: uncharacterized protein C20orf96-like isoform X2 [Branchiostoma belcheri]|uniref:Uncharacterized protein C20orf96-like isoform X2 n=1 Tax=Branchiostoma belcheri TaxID=7741 RepID=A0A6P4YXS8_BRABE|nr:PREDICTED: uncharacterized protein C20orf96-like isoform X2 [Branchiostoma belcheri]
MAEPQPEDDLLKSLESKFSAMFDYTQWQRTRAAVASAKSTKTNKTVKSQATSSRVTPDETLDTRTVGTACSSTCKHSWNRKDLYHILDEKAAKEAKKKEIEDNIMKMRIKARMQTVDEYTKRYEYLLSENKKLQAEIQGTEKQTHRDTTKLLRKYEKCRGAVSTINSKFHQDLESAQADLEETTERLNRDLENLHGELRAVEHRLKLKQEELHVLVTYKDKEYPSKALKISGLETELKDLAAEQEEELSELNRIIHIERTSFERQKVADNQAMTSNVTEKSISAMHGSLKDMALQNAVMKKEIEVHRGERETLKQDILLLEAELKQLIKDPKSQVLQQIFPHFFPKEPKCTPDMDVVLDIPTQEYLPI